MSARSMTIRQADGVFRPADLRKNWLRVPERLPSGLKTAFIRGMSFEPYFAPAAYTQGSTMAEIATGPIEALTTRDVVLASDTDSYREQLTAAGLSFRAVVPDVDEAAVHEVLLRDNEEIDPGDVAELMARKKAEETSAQLPGALVIGADQTLSLNGRIFHQPKDFSTARDTLFELRGKTHQLHSAVALAEGGQVTWTYIETAHLTMRPLSAQFVGRYLAAAGPQAYQSAGAYQLDGPGIQLFDRIEGDYFAILGLPILQLLVRLREIKLLA